MDKLVFLDSVARIAVFVSLLLALFLLTVKTENKLANRLFACFIIFSAIDFSGLLTYSFPLEYINIEFFRSTVCLLEMPLIYLYVLAVCYSDFRLKWKHLIYTIPFIVMNLVFMPRVYLKSGAEKQYVLAHFNEMSEIYFFQILIEFQYWFYIISIFLILRKYKRIYLENYTNPSTSTYKWLFQMTCVFVVMHSITASKNLLRYTASREIFLWGNVLMVVMALSVICWFVMKALNHPELFRGINSRLQSTKEFLSKEKEDVTEKAIITEDKVISSQILALKNYMKEKEPYLDPSLTIQDLANQFNYPVRDLSILINHHMKQHFFDFVNEYRIQKAMDILKDPSKNQFTVLEILYEVGFNSKSSFNTSFKKHTNLTPTAYRNAS
ncbi:AraC-type DNA-binding protein [Flavobacterium resistens]|uniref:AraC-type DNA-binding protein n=1 Tax=Flavobacterium resistens TaxID=443612 RepID=A0A521BAE8_9FLAO|nr:response regulator transcription factor [Flavobacterium resistens]MRX67187.1 helix-turn-helix domain-containing protein [Flavobacterium resistens]SMO44058.1 AraC-type DNA-binding protein [Flavobacterium resistens]